MALRADIVKTAQSLIGVQFKHQGRSRAGIDCIGVVVYVANQLGFQVEDNTAYGREPRRLILPKEMKKQLTLKCSALVEVKDCGCGAIHKGTADVNSAKPGDILLFSFLGSPQHVGIMGLNNTVIHAYQPRGKVCSHRIDAKWQRRLMEIYSFKEVAD